MSTALITFISLLATAMGIVAIVPQISRMLRHRSSAGQSPLGWILGASTNAGMLVVNTVAYHNHILAVGNLMSLIGCVTATLLTFLFDPVRQGKTALPRAHAVDDLPTQEFFILRDAVLHEHHRRTGQREIALD